MIFLSILTIIARILFGLIAVGFFLGMCLHEKYPIFKKIFNVTGICAICYGIGRMYVFAILGF